MGDFFRVLSRISRAKKEKRLSIYDKRKAERQLLTLSPVNYYRR